MKYLVLMSLWNSIQFMRHLLIPINVIVLCYMKFYSFVTYSWERLIGSEKDQQEPIFKLIHLNKHQFCGPNLQNWVGENSIKWNMSHRFEAFGMTRLLQFIKIIGIK